LEDTREKKKKGAVRHQVKKQVDELEEEEFSKHVKAAVEGTHFDTRSYFDGRLVRQDKRYRAIFPNPHYEEEARAARAWEKGNQSRLWNVTVALNRLFEAVRKHLKATYRLRDGKLGIHDRMGVTNKLKHIIYYTEEYIDLDEKKKPPNKRRR
jgi:hypothetical protein